VSLIEEGVIDFSGIALLPEGGRKYADTAAK
jgi:hypothetical protein